MKIVRTKPKSAARQDRVASGMTRWRREFPDVDCSGKAVVGRILHLHDRILREVNRVLASHDLRYPAYAILATLRVEGAPYRMSPKALLDTLILTSGGLSNLLRRLESEGLVRRLSDRSDRRGVIVELTPAGRRRVEPAMRDHAKAERLLVAALTEDERRGAERALTQMMGAVAQGRRKEPAA